MTQTCLQLIWTEWAGKRSLMRVGQVRVGDSGYSGDVH